MIRVGLPDGASLEFEDDVTFQAVAAKIGPGLARQAVAAVVQDRVFDMSRKVPGDVSVRFLTGRDPEALDVLRHSSAHLMAQAVKRLFPGARFGVGPVIENGFYYDIDLAEPLTPDDLERIEAEMKKISAEALAVTREELDFEAAIAWAKQHQDPFKEELIREFPPGEVISVYHQGEFTDLCTGPHVPTTAHIKHFKLLSVAGAYWRGDEKRQMLQRIYGTSFFDKKELAEHLHNLEEAKKRDHRKLGKQLDLFFMHPLAPGSPFFLPRGAFVYNRLIDYAREMYARYDYREVVTPQVFSADLWKISGHYDNYQDDMFFCHSEEREFGVKPMNCPGHMLMFASRVRSYRELPLRLADFGRLHRNERSGVIGGLTRVRSFSQDDAHIFIAPEMIGDELDLNFNMMREMYSDLGLDFPTLLLGTRPANSVGSAELWERAERLLRDALDRRGETYTINEGDGAFYGPKIDFVVRDALGRSWQLCTFQLDFNLPERFDLKYSAADGSQQRPVVIHRAILGSIERFLGVYLEHTAGNLPVWLCPEQARVLSVSQEVADYATQIATDLSAAGFRVEADNRSEKIGAKIREGTMSRIPYLLVVGGRERDERQVAVRVRGEGDRGVMGVADFQAELAGRIANKS